MNRTYFNVSQLAQLTGYDRATVAKHLQDIPYRPGPKASKLYWAPLAVRVIFELAKNGRLSQCSETLLNLIKSGELKPTPPQKAKSNDK